MILVIALVSSMLAQSVVRAADKAMVRESVFAVLDPDAIPDTIRVDVVSRRVAFARHYGCCSEVAVIDGKAQDPYDSVDNFTFSRDGRHVSYQGRRNELVYVAVDGKPGKGYVRAYDWHFSPDNKHFTYVGDRPTKGDNLPIVVVVDVSDYTEREYENAAVPKTSRDGDRMANVVLTQSGRQLVLVDGQEGPTFDEIGPAIGPTDSPSWARQPVFSPDGKRVAYIGRRGSQRTVVVDGSEGTYYDDIICRTLQFSPDGRRLAYIAKRHERDVLVVDRVESKNYDEVKSVVFSHDGRQIAFAARTGTQWRVVVDGQEKGTYESVESIVFSPDSRRLVWTARSRGGAFAVADGKEGPVYDAVGLVTFSNNGQHIAYRAVRAGRCVVVFDGRPGKEYDEISAPLLNFDGSVLAYDVTLRDKTQPRRPFVVINGSEQLSYDMSHGAAFSADRRHFRYVGWRAGRQFLIFDGKEQGPYREIAELSIQFSQNGNSVSYVVIGENDNQAVVVDGRLGEAYKEILRYPPLVWGTYPVLSEDGSHFAYVADGEDYQVLVVDGRESAEYELIISREVNSCPRSTDSSGGGYELIIPTPANSCGLSNYDSIFAYRGGKLFLIEVQLGNR